MGILDYTKYKTKFMCFFLLFKATSGKVSTTYVDQIVCIGQSWYRDWCVVGFKERVVNSVAPGLFGAFCSE